MRGRTQCFPIRVGLSAKDIALRSRADTSRSTSPRDAACKIYAGPGQGVGAPCDAPMAASSEPRHAEAVDLVAALLGARAEMKFSPFEFAKFLFGCDEFPQKFSLVLREGPRARLRLVEGSSGDFHLRLMGFEIFFCWIIGRLGSVLHRPAQHKLRRGDRILVFDGRRVRGKWNFEFMDVPEVKAKDQHTASFSGETVTKIIAEAEGQDKMIYALFAGTGMRAGEESGLEIDKYVIADFSTLIVEQTIAQRGGKLQLWTKTDFSEREIHLHPDLARALKAFIGERKTGFLFTSQSGKPLCQRNILGRSLHPVLKAIGNETTGFHAFRRFRNTFLRKQRVPDDLIKFWLGHSPSGMTEVYSKLKEDVEFRKKIAKKTGLGFKLPHLNQFICTKVRKRRQRKGPAILSQALVAA
jgi:integrase